MKIWHVDLNEKQPSPLSAKVFMSLTVLAETFEQCEGKVRKYIKENNVDPKNELYIGKIEFAEDVDIE